MNALQEHVIRTTVASSSSSSSMAMMAQPSHRYKRHDKEVSKKFGVRDMEKDWFDPIYLQCWEDKNWCYDIFYLFGIVKNLNGKVVATTRYSSFI